MTKPCRVLYKIKNGKRCTLGGYALIAKMEKAGRLLGAWSTSTGKSII